MSGRRFTFGPFLLDGQRAVLLRNEQVVPVGHPAVLLLDALLRAGGQVMTKAELMDAVWPKRVVEESNLSVQVAALRKVLGTTPAGGEWISTVARIGYRFAGPFTCVDEADRRGAAVAAGTTAAPPRIAVLPFANLGGDPQQEYFADGITEDVITALLRFRWFSVVGRNASFAFKGRSDATREIAAALDVRYVLEGSVRRAGDQVRITTELIDVSTASPIWADRFDFAVTDMLAVQDAIAQRVVGAIEPELLRSESERAHARGQGTGSAWDLVHRGAWLFHQVTPQGHAQARELFREACALDTSFALAQLWLARVSAGIVAYGWSKQEDADLEEGMAAALRAIHLDEKNPYTHYSLAITSVFAGRFEQALRAALRATELNPGFALGHLVLGMAHLYAGDAAAAVRPLEHGLKLNPFDPQNFVWNNVLAYAHLFSGEPQGALEAAQRALTIRPDWRPAMETAVYCHAALGQAAAGAGCREALARLPAPIAGDALQPLRKQNPHWVRALAALARGEKAAF